jgi:hypothetical protein
MLAQVVPARGPALRMTDFKITYPGFGAAIHALTDRAKKWLDEYADGIPVADGMMVEIGYLPHVSRPLAPRAL